MGYRSIHVNTQEGTFDEPGQRRWAKGVFGQLQKARFAALWQVHKRAHAGGMQQDELSSSSFGHRRIGLDLPRALAIALVLISHFVKRFEILGFYGVELFFALSGFLIGGILYRDLAASPGWTFPRVKHFWLRRWWRTLPNYYLFLIISLIFHAIYGGLPEPENLVRYLFFTQTMLQGNEFFYGVSWSLCIEECFYLLFPLSLLLLVSSGLSKKAAFVLATLTFLLAPAILREALLRAYPPHEVRMMTLPRLDSIFYGVGMAFAVHRFPMSATPRQLLLFAGILMVGTAGLLNIMFANTVSYRIAFFIVPGGFALMLPWLDTIRTFPALFGWVETIVQKLSLWSYSIYLSHIPILFTVYALFDPWRGHWAMNVLSKVVGLAVTLAVSRMLFVYFERPLTSLRPREVPVSEAPRPVSTGPSLLG